MSQGQSLAVVGLSNTDNMAGVVVNLLMGVTLVLICTVQSNDDIVSVINRIDDLDEDLIQMKTDLSRVDKKVRHQIDSAKVSLRSELKQHISEHVREALAGILQGESIEEMVRSQVITEVRQLRRGNHQMKRQLHRVLISLRDVQEEMNTYKEALVKHERGSNEMNGCSKYVTESEIVKRDLKEELGICNQQMDRKERENLEMKENLELLNQTCQLQLRETNPSSTTTQEVTSPSGTTTTSSPMITSLTTATKPEEQRSRVIIAPIYSSTQHQFRQLNIHNNIVSVYQLRSLKHVISVAYVSKLRKLLIGLYSPDKIISTYLDNYDVKTMRENVETLGMAVDEEREIVFLTTSDRRYTVSRMTTQGKHFTAIVDLRDYASYPYAIAVNPKHSKIYACNHGKVFVVSYDGSGLQTLATGSSMYGVTLDNTGSILYYNVGKTLMKMSLSDNVVTNVTTLDVTPWTITYYRDTVYYSSWNSATGTMGAVDVGYNVVSYTLQTIILKGVTYYAICLVP